VAGGLADRPTTAIAESWAPANPPVAPPTVRLSSRLVGVLAGSLAIVLIVSGIRWATDRASLNTRGSPVVAVLPFSVTGDDQALASLAVGLADRLISDLARLPGLVVVPRSATLAFVGPGAAARAALDQGTSHVVQGTLSPSGDDVSLDVLLISSDGRIVWSRQFHGRRDNVLGLEPRVHQDLAAALIGTLNVPRSVQTTGQTDPQAARYYSDALTLLERRDIPDNIPRAIQLFNLAIDRDPRWAPPYLGLFEAYWARYRLNKERDLPDQARAALDKARELDPDYPGLHYRMALHYRNTGKTAEAMAELDQAIANEPNGDAAYTQRGQILYERGDIEAGLAAFQKVVELRPAYLRGWTTLAVAAQRRGRLEDAEVAYRKATQLQPESPAGYAGLAAVYHVTKRLVEAEESYKTAILLGAEGNVRDNFGQLYWETGRYREAVEILERLVTDIPGREIYWRHLGDAYAAAGRGEEALNAYRQAVKAGGEELKVNPRDGRTLSSVAVSEAKAGLSEQARQHALQAVGFSPRDSDVLYRATVVNLLSGDRASALTYLRQAIEAGYPATRAAEDKDLAPLRSSPEFKDIVSPPPKM
jgi:tetratricopeptide (TPR) repeat protein